MKPLIIIPVRGGSKGIPGKNIKKLGGKPLIQYTLDAARELFSDKQICVSTDSPKIKEVVEHLGLEVPFLRPDELASDTASTYDVLLHALNYYEDKKYHPDVIILLQATSPFRTSKHIREALELYSNEYDMVVSVKETKSNPYYVLFEEDEDGWLTKSKTGSFTRRQDAPKVWEYNGAVYVINPKSLREKNHFKFRKVKKYVMDELSSIDLDEELDWRISEFLLKEQIVQL
ncbi:MAG: acylneuraminate cytidylyltransferase family protein [Flavobacteriaceae bacterium]|nr:acylneuraminate cytidylyltransferase family protein [Bacteroidia bacterium]NND10755.1 acylneuraminate cytidylyltransferase family protein [Flavobacteriaceae bacterium]NNF85782.1 acylneuraminate cytidylyltransferase family protein [Winogradskyella sp.]MBT8278040.1 acylneuraminate cytidylyltransferase family protein [Bacteroidia bacterium]MBT8393606.1 acylneuraminate cytidylyltransferase family protein [Bacteroidia bacterium]